MLLANIIDEITLRLNSGEVIEIEDYVSRYPELAGVLPGVLETLTLVRQPPERDGNDDSDDSQVYGLLGDFRILRQIGRGGMGVVYEAEQISLRRRMALKVLPFAGMLDPQRLKRFKNEARAAATLDHPNIVAVHSVGEERGVHYFAMQLVEGQSLVQVIAELRKSRGLIVVDRSAIIRSSPDSNNPSGSSNSISARNAPDSRPDRGAINDNPALVPEPLPPSTDTVRASQAAISTVPSFDSREYYRTVARLGEQAARALDHAHQNGIVHRDVKPGNLMVDAAGKLWVTDFGLARMDSESGVTLSGDLLGTLAYMSPEQALAQRTVVDHRTDIYSLGATLYELLTLRPPYSGKDRQELLKRIAFDEPRRPRQFNRLIPPDLETIVNKAMEKDAVDRYKSAVDLADDLRRFLEDLPIVARRVSLGVLARKWLRRHTALVAALVAVVFLVVAGLTVSTVLIGRQKVLVERQRDLVSRQSVRAEQNLQLALAALEQTLAESVVGDLIVEPVDAKRAELERRGIKFYEEFANKNGLDPSTWPAYRLLVFNQRRNQAYSQEAENPQAAEVAYTDSIAQATQLVTATHGEPKNQARLIHCIDDYGSFLGERGRREEALRQSMEAGRLADSLIEQYPDFPTNPYLQGTILYNRSKLYEADKPADARRCCREALVFLEKAFAAEPNEIRVVYVLASCRYNLGLYLGQGGRDDEAEKQWNDALRDWRALTLLRPLSSEYHSRAGATLSNLAVLARRRGDFKQCRDLARQALDHQKRALAAKPVYKLAKEFLSKHYQELSLAVESLGDYHSLAACSEDRVASLSDVPFESCLAAMSLARCVRLAKKDGTLNVAEQTEHVNRYAERALAVLDSAVGRFEEDSAIILVADAYSTVGDILAIADRKDDARQAWQAARKLVAEKPREFDMFNYQQLSLAVESLEDCDALAARAEERVTNLPGVPFETCAAATSLAECVLLAQKDQKRSVAERTEHINRYAERALAMLESAAGRFKEDSAIFMVADAYSTVGDLLAETERSDDARRAWQAARKLVVELQAKALPVKRHQLDSFIQTADERLGISNEAGN
jgi:serine/threonine protein kinase/predicted negative regulator of RcsB-dependent stress response